MSCRLGAQATCRAWLGAEEISTMTESLWEACGRKGERRASNRGVMGNSAG